MPWRSGLFADDGPDYAYTIPYPSSGTRHLLDRLDFILERHRLDLLIPTLDAEIEPLIRLEPELTRRGIRTCLPTLDAFRARAKHVLDRLCADCGCATYRSASNWPTISPEAPPGHASQRSAFP